MERVDVCVVGGGVAGASIAAALARAGRTVAVYEREPAVRRKTGEVLIPAARRLLPALGIDVASIDRRHARCAGTLSAWHGSAVDERDAIFDPDGEGWHLDRVAFERDLLTHARSLGASIFTGTRAGDIAFSGEEWRFGGISTTARFVVDATGRRASIARALGAVRRREDDQVAVCALFRASDTEEMRTIVERTERGWWYAARLADHTVSLAFHAAPRVARVLRDPAALIAAVRSTRLISRIAGRSLLEGPRVEAAHGALTLPPAGERWIAVGDAALAFDPLASRGIFSALYSGVVGAACIDRALDGDRGATARYGAELLEVARIYAAERSTLRDDQRRPRRAKHNATSANNAT